MLRIVSMIVPLLLLAVVTIAVTLPWGLPDNARYILPMLPLAVIHYWTLRHPGSIADWMAFASGLTVDLLTNGPLGFWALVYLLGFATAVVARPWADTGALGRWVVFAFSMIVVTIAAWFVLSVYTLSWPNILPLLKAWCAVTLGYPVFAGVMRVLDISRAVGQNTRLERGA